MTLWPKLTIKIGENVKCRFCQNKLELEFADLHFSPPCNAMLSAETLGEEERYYPLRVFVCDNCFLVQIDETVKSTSIFDDTYTYFSSFSTSWIEHARRYSEMIIDRLHLDKDSLVLEIASNDGYLLQHFVEHAIPVIGVEPSANTANVAMQKGIRTFVEFFDKDFATCRLPKEVGQADLIIANNVIAHVPDINNFVAAMKLSLSIGGTITLEFPHLLKLIEKNQFDTIYHEHYSYLSFFTIQNILKRANLQVYDVEELPTHGGSLRVYSGHMEEELVVSQNVDRLIRAESDFGLRNLGIYLQFQQRVDRIKYDLLSFLLEQRRHGRVVVGYGAAGKGNALLNYCGIKGNDLIRFVADISSHKQNMFLPGSHIPVVHEREIKSLRPDFIIIFPWNLEEEITRQLGYVRKWGCKFVTSIPELRVF